MRVLHVIPSLSEVHGGPTRALREMEGALSALGVHVETATTDDDGPGRRNGKPCGRLLDEQGALRWYFRKRTEFYKVAPAFGRWAPTELKRFDVVHVHALFSYTSTSAALAARRAGVPYILRPLGTLDAYGLENRRSWLKRASLRWVESGLLASAAAVHFTSSGEAQQAQALGLPMQGVVVPLGIATAPSQPAPRGRDAGSGPFTLLFLSRLDRKKNVEGLLQALAIVVRQGLPVRLVIAGAGEPPYVETLRALALREGVAGHVEWAGHVQGEAKARLLREADVFVLPSFSENFGIAAAEALAAGLPCVLGEGVAIAADVAAAGAGLVTAPQAHAIAQTLARIIAQTDELESMSIRAARLAAQKYSRAVMGPALLDLYRAVRRA